MFRFTLVASLMVLCLATFVMSDKGEKYGCKKIGKLSAKCPLDKYPEAEVLDHCVVKEKFDDFAFCTKICCWHKESKLPYCDKKAGLEFVCTK